MGDCADACLVFCCEACRMITPHETPCARVDLQDIGTGVLSSPWYGRILGSLHLSHTASHFNTAVGCQTPDGHYILKHLHF